MSNIRLFFFFLKKKSSIKYVVCQLRLNCSGLTEQQDGRGLWQTVSRPLLQSNCPQGFGKTHCLPCPAAYLGQRGNGYPRGIPAKEEKKKTIGELGMGRDLEKQSLAGSGAGWRSPPGPAGDKALRLPVPGNTVISHVVRC